MRRLVEAADPTAGHPSEEAGRSRALGWLTRSARSRVTSDNARVSRSNLPAFGPIRIGVRLLGLASALRSQPSQNIQKFSRLLIFIPRADFLDRASNGTNNSMGIYADDPIGPVGGCPSLHVASEF